MLEATAQKATIHLGAPTTADELTACVGQKAWCHWAVSARAQAGISVRGHLPPGEELAPELIQVLAESQPPALCSWG